MSSVKEQLEALFKQLDSRIDEINAARRKDTVPRVQRCEVKLLGQVSLLANDKVAAVLSLAQTADIDALLTMDVVVRREFKLILRKFGFLYDEDSYLIWIPKRAKFAQLFDYKNVAVKIIDPESTLVSKAVKAPKKNRQLIREAIASGEFQGLVDRILECGGDLSVFISE